MLFMFAVLSYVFYGLFIAILPTSIVGTTFGVVSAAVFSATATAAMLAVLCLLFASCLGKISSQNGDQMSVSLKLPKVEPLQYHAIVKLAAEVALSANAYLVDEDEQNEFEIHLSFFSSVDFGMVPTGRLSSGGPTTVPLWQSHSRRKKLENGYGADFLFPIWVTGN